MRFHQLPPGARFEYRGNIYRKLDKLKASPEDGGKTSLIPRSADVRPAPEQSQHSPEDTRISIMDGTQRLEALHRYCQDRLCALSEGASPDQIAEFKQELEIVYQRLAREAAETSS